MPAVVPAIVLLHALAMPLNDRLASLDAKVAKMSEGAPVNENNITQSNADTVSTYTMFNPCARLKCLPRAYLFVTYKGERYRIAEGRLQYQHVGYRPEKQGNNRCKEQYHIDTAYLDKGDLSTRLFDKPLTCFRASGSTSCECTLGALAAP